MKDGSTKIIKTIRISHWSDEEVIFFTTGTGFKRDVITFSDVESISGYNAEEEDEE